MAYAHRYLIKKTGRNIQLVIMCDDYIYSHWGNVLSQYFDRVIRIEMFELPLAEKYQFVLEKYDWMKWILNKWQCLKLTEYHKILCVDIDMLPVDVNFYNIFDFETPSFYFRSVKGAGYQPQCRNNDIYQMGEIVPFDHMIQQISDDRAKTIDAGLCLLSPSMEDYDKYLQLAKEIFAKGMYSSQSSGPEETSLLYYYWLKLGGSSIHMICDEYDVIPWDMPKMADRALLYNYISFIKPWLKASYMQWDEEMLWSDLFTVMNPPQTLVQLYHKETKQMCDHYLSLNNVQQRKFFDQMVPPLVNCDRINDPQFTRQRRTYIRGRQYGKVLLKDLAGVFT